MQAVAADFGDLFARGETGLMGLVLDPGLRRQPALLHLPGRHGRRRRASIAGDRAGPSTDDWRSATRVADPLIGGIPVNSGSGRHGGCRLRFDPDGALLIGTGDNAVGSNPQDRTSLAGKVLRRPGPAARPTRRARSPSSGHYGHRNVQGLAVRPGTAQVFAVEQGTFRDDEVNLLRAGRRTTATTRTAPAAATTRACR